VYPMNALCNSQYGELGKFLCYGYPDQQGPVRFSQYTGQERGAERLQIIENPPDVLLTNYVMLELILTRPDEKKSIVSKARGLQFLVLDELHIYRGRQGADVALLVRRVRDACEATNLQCIGTSATLAGPGEYDEQCQEIAAVATRLFGDTVKPQFVIGETLKRVTPENGLSSPDFATKLRDVISAQESHQPNDYGSFIHDPLSAWIENILGISLHPDSGRLVRTKPRPVTGPNGVAKDLSAIVKLPEERCAKAIEQRLLLGYSFSNPDTGFPTFAFRLHQFFSRGDTVHTSIETEGERYITAHGQQFVPNDRTRTLLPLVFCRECGQEYYCVRVSSDSQTGKRIYSPRELNDRASDETNEPGFLYVSSESPWPIDASDATGRLPEDWLEEHQGSLRIRKDRKKDVPQVVRVGADSIEDEHGIECCYPGFPISTRNARILTLHCSWCR